MKLFNRNKINILVISLLMLLFSSSLFANNEQILSLQSQIRSLENRLNTKYSSTIRYLNYYIYLKDQENKNRTLSKKKGLSAEKKQSYIKKYKYLEKKSLAYRKKYNISPTAVVIYIDLKTKKSLLDKTKNVSLNPIQASRLLQQATFGPTIEGITQLTNRSAWEWLQNQFALPATSHLSLLKNRTGSDKPDSITRIEAWWNASLHANDQLRQRTAFALSEIFVVSDKTSSLGGQPAALATYYDILVRNSFGNYRNLLEEITLSPVMGNYLSHLGNEKANIAKNIRPDENYAREVLQLFSIGLVELNIDGTPKLDYEGKTIPTYSQEEISGFANVFTGWTFAGRSAFKKWSPEDWLSPMIAFDDYHSKEPKTLLNGITLTPDQSAQQDLTQALDNIFNHPNVGPFIGKQLIQRLVTSNPTPQYVARVATVFNNNGMGVRGDLKAVVQAILLDPEARQTVGVMGYSGKIREPLLRTTHLWRALKAYTNNDTLYTWSLDDNYGQTPLGSGSVFNFFRPDYSPTIELQSFSLVSPELQIANDSTLIAQINTLWSSTLWSLAELDEGKSTGKMLIKIAPLVDIINHQGTQALIDHLNLVFLAGNMDAKLQEVLMSIANQTTNMGLETRVSLILFTILVSPNYVTQI
jgi:uncharacterized protein (DUF1800 family)